MVREESRTRTFPEAVVSAMTTLPPDAGSVEADQLVSVAQELLVVPFQVLWAVADAQTTNEVREVPMRVRESWRRDLGFMG